MMFIPGNNPGMMQDAFIYAPDAIMLDLEDSVTMCGMALMMRFQPKWPDAIWMMKYFR